jgi:DNA replication and repair protein RecF
MSQLVLNHLSLVNFKSYQQAEINLSENVNCFTGDNGTGKTNLLDAIYYLAFCKSFFNPIDVQNIYNEEDFFMIQGKFNLKENEETIYCGNHKLKKKVFKRNDKEYSKLAEHIGVIPLVMVNPADTHIINDGSDVRRKFIDGVISQYDKTYLSKLLAYNKSLYQRNNLLKHFAEERRFDESLIDVYDHQLNDFGKFISNARKQFLQEFIPTFRTFYQRISQKAETVGFDYKSHLDEHPDLMELFELSRKDDRAARYTTKGIHKDDLIFTLEERPLRKFGSQGQQKTFVTALKMTQFNFMKEKKGLKPLLLLDDIFDKLDDQRVKSIMQMVSSEEFGQIFVTDTSRNRLEGLFDDIHQEVKYFEIDHLGKISEHHEKR